MTLTLQGPPTSNNGFTVTLPTCHFTTPQSHFAQRSIHSHYGVNSFTLWSQFAHTMESIHSHYVVSSAPQWSSFAHTMEFICPHNGVSSPTLLCISRPMTYSLFLELCLNWVTKHSGILTHSVLNV